MNLDPRIQDILKAYLSDLSSEEKENVLWEVRRGTYAIYHKYVELIGQRAGVVVQKLDWIHMAPTEKIAVCQVLAYMNVPAEEDGKFKQVWVHTTGECAPYNNKNSYPVAMAEKRATDRAILKLVGLHGLVYSEDEADDFRESAPAAGGRGKRYRLDDRAPEPEPDVTETSATVDDGLPFDEPEPVRGAQIDIIEKLIRRVRRADEEKADGYAAMVDELTDARAAAGLIIRIQNWLKKQDA